MKELIKHFVDRAEGFSLTKWSEVYETFSCPLYEHSHEIEWWLSDDLFMDIGFPLFLQRAIEGVNLKDDGYRIEQMYDMIDICDSEEYDCQIRFEYENYTSPDKAKIAALQWIMEQEQKERRIND